MQTSSPVVLEPSAEAEATLLLVYGMGTSGETYVPMARRIQERVNAPLRVVLPHAPQRHISLMNGEATTAWFDLRDKDFRVHEDEQGIMDSSGYLTDLIEEQASSGVPTERVVVSGFSQGGALALRVGTTLQARVAGIAALSGWLPLAKRTQAEYSCSAEGVPVFLGHGTEDDTAPQGWVEQVQGWLEPRHPVQLREYSIGHAVNLEEIDDLASWLDSIL